MEEIKNSQPVYIKPELRIISLTQKGSTTNSSNEIPEEGEMIHY